MLPNPLLRLDILYTVGIENLPDCLSLATSVPIYRFITEFNLYGIDRSLVEIIVSNIISNFQDLDGLRMRPVFNDNLLIGISHKFETMASMAVDSVIDLINKLQSELYDSYLDVGLFSNEPFYDGVGESYWSLFNYAAMTNTLIFLNKIPI